MTERGRKRSFDKTEALEKAMRLFWNNGYVGTSLSDLTNALDINKPSLYAAFGNKEQLFGAAFNHYMEHYGSPLMQHLREPANQALSKRLENYFLALIQNNFNEALPKGCFIVNSCCESGGTNIVKKAPTSIQDLGADGEKALQNIFLLEEKNNQLPNHINSKEMTAFVLSLMYGLSVMARRGKSHQELHSIVKTTMKTLFI
jgi:TetR/AcrR family transcriptional regulator, copper-responsive repressor